MKIVSEQIEDVEILMGGGTDALTVDTDINLDNSMTAVEMQALIDAVPKNLGGHTLALKFADGTYNLTSALAITGFHGGGSIYAHGNLAELYTLHTNQAVIFDITANAFDVYKNSVPVEINRMRFNIPYGPNIGVNMTYNPALVTIYGCYFQGSGYGSGIYPIGVNCSFGSKGKSNYNYFSNLHVAIHAMDQGKFFSQNSVTTGTTNNVGIQVYNGGVVTKGGTQPTANTSEGNGIGGDSGIGVIR